MINRQKEKKRKNYRVKRIQLQIVQFSQGASHQYETTCNDVQAYWVSAI